jgi:membrane dipeptidase
MITATVLRTVRSATQVREGDFIRMVKSAATLDDVAAHIVHAVQFAGIDHVGIGSNFGIESAPQGLEDVSKMPALAAALRKHGYSDQDVRKIFGGNFLRVVREVTGK